MYGKTIDLAINAAKLFVCVDADDISYGNADSQSIISNGGPLKRPVMRFQLMVRVLTHDVTKNLTGHRMHIQMVPKHLK